MRAEVPPWSCPHPKVTGPPTSSGSKMCPGESAFLIKTPVLGIQDSGIFQEFGTLAKSSQPADLDPLHSTWTLTLYSLQWL